MFSLVRVIFEPRYNRLIVVSVDEVNHADGNGKLPGKFVDPEVRLEATSTFHFAKTNLNFVPETLVL